MVFSRKKGGEKKIEPHFLFRASWGNVDWDVIIFTQQWPITSCIHHLAHNPKASCNLFPNMTSWTVHGIWPTKLGTIGPNYCNKSWDFQESEILNIEPYLIKYWGNIFGEDSRTSLWSHEWKKHGTCAAQLPSLNSEKKYFEKGLEWVTQYDYVAVLGQHKIYPDDVQTYTREALFAAVKDMFGVDPSIDCIYNKKTKQHELSQIKLCFDRSLHLVDCDGIIGANEEKVLGNCPFKGITYPASVRTGGKNYHYPHELVELRKKRWEEAQATCVSWLCHALMTVYSLMWITL
ncbi:ribonuclease Oy-like [Penaeus monodon]|uniref:ribonuclease Oy-like n=1 Tax=Penaeus monodon TaxID=6687 RepID=UPI0018A7188F|nr:ribonuclease Oy-like [Penaeus monodon]